MKKFLLLTFVTALVLIVGVGCNTYEPNPIIRAWSNNIAVVPMTDSTTGAITFAMDTIYFVSLNNVDCEIDSLNVEYYNGSTHLTGYDVTGFDLSPLYIYGKVDSMNVPMDTTYLFNANFIITNLYNNYLKTNTNVPSIKAQFYFYGSNLGGNKFFTYDGFSEAIINPFYQ